MGLRPLGLIITAVALVAPFLWWPTVAAETRDLTALFSQYLGIQALVAMAIVQLISTRWTGIEFVFGGLDRSYILHKWLGIFAMAAILLHDTIDADMDGLGPETGLVELGDTLGEISLYGLLILVIITIATFIPYHLWRWTHRLMGLFFTFGALHYLLVLKPFQNGDPLGLYTSAFCILGVLAFAYRLLPAGVRPAKAFKITEITPTGHALAITMAPKGRKLRHHAGQFAFLSIKGAEPHPFTLSSAPNPDGTIRMTIAQLGDYTNTMSRKIEIGTSVRLEGPFGHFTRRTSQKPELWIGAGVGITPFMAWAQDLTPENGPVHLVYCIRNTESAAHLDELQKLAAEKPYLNLIVQNSAKDGRATPATLLQHTGLSTDALTVAFCGPKAMRKSLKEDFTQLGLAANRFKYEEFEIRTGVGLRRLAAYLFDRVTRARQT